MEGQELDLGDCLSIFIFDWDDTLFPTSALVAAGPERLRPALAQVDLLAAQLLTTALALPRSRVMVLTNANIDWIYHSAREFLPRVSGLLAEPAENLRVVSAHLPRQEGGRQGRPAGTPVDPLRAARQKLEAVHAQAPALQGLIEALGAGAFQVLGLGDSPHDLEAAHALAGLLRAEASYVKTVAMRPRPCEAELVGQLRALASALAPLARRPRSYHQNMHQKPNRPADAAPAATSPPLVQAQALASEAVVMMTTKETNRASFATADARSPHRRTQQARRRHSRVA